MKRFLLLWVTLILLALPVVAVGPCGACWGSGDCQTCAGSGVDPQGVGCLVCSSSGDCYPCSGSGNR